MAKKVRVGAEALRELEFRRVHVDRRRPRRAPAARATGIAIKPIEPTPVITTLLMLTPAAITVCTAFPSGSKTAAKSSGIAGSSRHTLYSGIAMILGERAVAIDADDLHALADVRLTGAAEQADAIRDVSLGRDALARSQPRDRVADGRHRAHELVPDDERRA